MRECGPRIEDRGLRIAGAIKKKKRLSAISKETVSGRVASKKSKKGEKRGNGRSRPENTRR
jgi:hypothetical protein